MNNLKALRESLNLKQSDVAAAVGLPKTTYSNYETGARDPKPDFCITVQGNSMEPYLYDRDLAYVKRGAPLKEYDVGVFSINGETLIKRWYVDRSGVLHLRSINPAASGSNRVIPRYSQDTFVCFGKVINEKKPPRGET